MTKKAFSSPKGGGGKCLEGGKPAHKCIRRGKNSTDPVISSLKKKKGWAGKEKRRGKGHILAKRGGDDLELCWITQSGEFRGCPGLFRGGKTLVKA